jgi:hypothetical protein
MDSIIDNDILVHYPNTSVVAYHNDGSNTDPFAHFYGFQIISAMGIFSNPTAFINRGSCNAIGFETISFKTDSLYKVSPQAPVRIEFEEKTWVSNRRFFSVLAKFIPLGDIQGDIFYNMVITENNLVFYQNGHPDKCFGGENYTHNNVARVVLGSPEGNNICSKDTVWKSGVEKKAFDSWPLDLGMIEDNCNVQIFVFKRTGALDKSEILQSLKIPLSHGVGIEDHEISLREGILRIYPNPASTKVNIHFRIDCRSAVSLELTDMSGKKTDLLPRSIMDPGLYNMEFTRPDIPSGLYTVCLKTVSGVYPSKLVLTD